MTALLSLDPVAVRAPNLAAHNFGLRLGDGLAVADVLDFQIFDMVKIQRHRMTSEAAINTSVPDLVVIQPSPHGSDSGIRMSVNALSVTWNREPSFAPLLRLNSVVRGGDCVLCSGIGPSSIWHERVWR